MASDGLFIIGSENFDQALELGLYPALAYLVMARGTQANHTTTAWSAKAVKNSIGVRWQKCHDAIDQLIQSGLVCRHQNRAKSRPRYSLAKVRGEKIFLPNALVDGLDDSTPPLRRIRESQNLDVLQLLINFYRLQNLASDHGINPEFLNNPADVDYIMELGQFKVWSATRKGIYRTSWDCPLTKPWVKSSERFWEALKSLDSIGLIELAWYVTDADGELLYPFTDEIAASTDAWIDAREIPSRARWEGDFCFLTLRHQKSPQFVGLYRVRFRTPHTSMTGEWLADVGRMENEMLRRLEC